ncbi:MAG: 50S ribosomal protein L32 [Elusimicrobia bacterium]|nr:50S ribosomal protein L32 [Elusimicrobiota bacterium]
MPNPKRKFTRARRDSRRRSAWRLEASSASKCSNCGNARQPHRVCPSCGFYNGKLVIAAKVKKKKGAEGQEGEQQ